MVSVPLCKVLALLVIAKLSCAEKVDRVGSICRGGGWRSREKPAPIAPLYLGEPEPNPVVPSSNTEISLLKSSMSRFKQNILQALVAVTEVDLGVPLPVLLASLCTAAALSFSTGLFLRKLKVPKEKVQIIEEVKLDTVWKDRFTALELEVSESKTEYAANIAILEDQLSYWKSRALNFETELKAALQLERDNSARKLADLKAGMMEIVNQERAKLRKEFEKKSLELRESIWNH